MKKLTKQQVAELLAISTKTVERKCKAGILPQPDYSLGSRLPRWDGEELAALFDKQPQMESLSDSR